MASFGDSARLRVGARVFAIGSPLTFEQSTTAGVVCKEDNDALASLEHTLGLSLPPVMARADAVAECGRPCAGVR